MIHTYAAKMPNNSAEVYRNVSPVVQFLFIFKHPKRFHSITELLGVLVVYFSWGCEANGRSDAIMFLRLLPTRHGAAEGSGGRRGRGAQQDTTHYMTVT